MTRSRALRQNLREGTRMRSTRSCGISAEESGDCPSRPGLHSIDRGGGESGCRPRWCFRQVRGGGDVLCG
ncbi:pollen-specific leucine-rich repeat extensin-like protein 3 [Iris pallida]|uniref:Pollen-specific leucine-rich repeat extensin-like protein 3 n=1 Tax=Iris pallida TaxID=29817 RepID=A0AAX6HLL9_IRIPA|nr:pollen-specific leucine-rich repeat extensin-like protein 3 [Iris pallida]KAJ6841577.1 pollen-specific leucine-rich repeat extensin-like protein 3 [Iris pallida]